jgi:hypothetical protein
MPRSRSILVVVAICGLAVLQGQGTWAASPTPAPTPALGEICQLDARPFDPADLHLTGPWAVNDGGVYYIRQTGSSVAWNGMSGRYGLASDLGREWNNVAIGTLGDDGIIKLDWMDVPRGQVLGGGTLVLRVQGDPGGSLQIVKVSETGTGFGGETFTPCVPKTLSADSFQPSFTFHDAVGDGLGFDDQIAQVGMWPGSPYDSGISVWRITETSGVTCDARTPLQPGAQAFLDWLHARTDLVVSDGVAVTVGGLPATSVDIKSKVGASRCLDGWIRMWQSFGNDAAVSPSSMARVAVLDVGDKTVAIEEWGLHQDQWLPLAQQIVDTIQWAQ